MGKAMLKSLYIVIAILLAAFPARAEIDAAALAEFEAGQFAAAADLAAQKGGADNLAFAARALNAKAYLDDDDKSAKNIAKRAYDFAEDAMAADPDAVEAHLQGAIALAQRGSRISVVKAFFMGLGGKSRDHLDAALAIDPNSAWTLSTSGGWHLGVADRAGDGRFGADAQKGVEQFQAALAREPDNIAIAYEAALRILAYGREEWRPVALDALEFALAASPNDALETALQGRARSLAVAIEEGPERETAFIEAQP